MELDMVLHLRIEVFQDHVVDVRPQVADRRIQELELVLDTDLLEIRARRGVEFCPLTAVRHVDRVHVLHQLQGLLFADILVERPAEVIGDIILPIAEGARSAEAGHNGTALASDAGLHLVPVDGTAALFQLVSSLKDADLPFRPFLHQLIGGKNTSGARPDNDHIILFS